MLATANADQGCVELVFGDGGLLSQHFDGYSPRQGQINLANEIDETLLMGGHLISEAGTGVGKSFGYLVPAIAHAVSTGSRVVVATANIALQEQLVRKDLPFLQRILPWKFKFALRKGKGNYLCESAHSSLLMAQEQGEFQGSGFGGGRRRASSGELEQILAWAETTETGDKNELPFVPSNAAWSRVSVGQDDCKGKRCRWFKSCHAMAAARKADEAQIIVVNHHLLFANIKYGGAILPQHSVVILDEAHEAVSIARDFLGFRIGEGTFKRLAARMRTFGLDDLAKDVADAGAELFRLLARHRDSRDYGVRLVRPDCVDSSRALHVLQRAHDALEHCARTAMTEDAAASIDIERDRAANAMLSIKIAMSLKDENMVVHLDADRDDEDRGDDEDRVWIEGKPLDVAKILGPTLFAHTPSVILTSATLTVNGSFDHAISQLGVDDPAEIEVESPFNPENRILVVPRGMPDPKDFKEWSAFVCEKVQDIIEMAGGRTLALFTSHAMLRRVREHLDAYLYDHRVLVQGDMPRTALIREFKEDETSSLLGTRSFWAGVDVPGPSCSVVIIDKMPFANPKDPIENAFEERLGRNMFMKRMVPEAIMQFKQGAGRLIRSMDDRGALVMLDRRITDKGYGAKFINSLGEIQVSRDLEDIRRILVVQAAAEDSAQNYYEDEIPF